MDPPHRTALPSYVYERTGSALATGAKFVAQMIPRILLAPIAGVYVDCWDRRRTMIVVDVARALILLPLVTIHSRDWFWVVPVDVTLVAIMGLPITSRGRRTASRT